MNCTNEARYGLPRDCQDHQGSRPPATPACAAHVHPAKSVSGREPKAWAKGVISQCETGVALPRLTCLARPSLLLCLVLSLMHEQMRTSSPRAAWVDLPYSIYTHQPRIRPGPALPAPRALGISVLYACVRCAACATECAASCFFRAGRLQTTQTGQAGLCNRESAVEAARPATRDAPKHCMQFMMSCSSGMSRTQSYDHPRGSMT